MIFMARVPRGDATWWSDGMIVAMFPENGN